MGMKRKDTFISADGVAVPLSLYIKQIEEGNNKKKFKLEAEEYNKDSGRFLHAVGRSVGEAKKAEKHIVYSTKIFSAQEIREEDEKMRSEIRRKVLEVLMKNEGQWISGNSVAEMVGGPKSSVSSILTGISKFLEEEGLGDRKKDDDGRGLVHRFKAHITGDVKEEANLLYAKFLVWEREHKKSKGAGKEVTPAPKKEEAVAAEPGFSFKDFEPGGGIYNSMIGTILENLPKPKEGSTLNVNVQVKVLFGLVKE